VKPAVTTTGWDRLGEITHTEAGLAGAALTLTKEVPRPTRGGR
jgi:hypothetical protein